MRLLPLLTAALLALTPLTAAANDVVLQVPVDDSFVTGDIGWTGGMSGRFYMAWRPIEADGKLLVCGLYAVTNSQLNTPVNNMLRGGSVSVRGKKVISNLRFFNKARTQNRMTTTPANCAVTSATKPYSDITIDLGSGGFRN